MTEHPVHIPDMPAPEQIDRLVALLEPLARITQPKVYGLERVPADGSLLVGNHTIYGFLDLPFMMAEVWKRRRLTIRGLGEHAHYAVPLWRDMLATVGMVRGTRDNVRALMRERQTVLVFPGGAREVNKRRGEQYQLMWKERLGFARLAIEHGYPIVPFAAVGAEEMLDVLVDHGTPGYGQLLRLYENVTRLPAPPFVRGVGVTPVPRPERLYFWFGEPIDTTRFAGRHDDDAAARALRDEVKSAVEGGIAFLRDERARDPHRRLVRRLLSSASDQHGRQVRADDVAPASVGQAKSAMHAVSGNARYGG
jgi:1-acyl-sn-glycerol-3-phosphate acyltransferase